MPAFDEKLAQQFISKLFDESVVPSLSDFVKIPNLSRNFDPEWATNGRLEEAAEHVRKWVLGLGIEGISSEIIKDEGYSPIVFSEIKGDLDVTLFFYGHYDKQPEMVGWDEGLGATKPVIKDGKLYGRGGADDGYATYGTMLAIKSIQEQKVPIPRCVMITEGDEESGSGHMPHYLEKLKARIGDPKIFFCLDSGTIDYDRFWLTNSLRGVYNFTLRVEVMESGVHSGDSAGIAPSAFRIARQLLDRLEDPKTGEVHKLLQVDVPPNRYQETYNFVQEKKEDAVKEFPLLEGVERTTPHIMDSVMNRAWKAQLTVIGQSGLPEAKTAGNVNIPAFEFRCSLRLPPTKSGSEAEKAVKELLETNPPNNAKVSVYDGFAANGWNATSYSAELLAAIKESSEQYYSNQYLACGEGGSIPLMNILSQMWPKGQFLITGVLGPNSNAHGPNEFLHLDYCKKLICCMAHIIAKVSPTLK